MRSSPATQLELAAVSSSSTERRLLQWRLSLEGKHNSQAQLVRHSDWRGAVYEGSAHGHASPASVSTLMLSLSYWQGDWHHSSCCSTLLPCLLSYSSPLQPLLLPRFDSKPVTCQQPVQQRLFSEPIHFMHGKFAVELIIYFHSQSEMV